MEKIFTTIDCGVLCHSVNGEYIFSVNRAALKILGYESQEELIESGFDMVAASVLDEDKEKLRKRIRELKEEGDSVSVEYKTVKGEWRIILPEVPFGYYSPEASGEEK